MMPTKFAADLAKLKKPSTANNSVNRGRAKLVNGGKSTDLNTRADPL